MIHIPALREKLPRLIALLLCMAMLMGCGAAPTPAPSETTAGPTAATEPLPTAPANGDPDNVTCLGSYTASEAELQEAGDDVVAVITVTRTEIVEVPSSGEGDTEASEPTYDTIEIVEEHTLTNRQLQVFYWMEVAAYQQAGHEIGPDLSQGLDTQICPIDDTVNSWQQYFLREALDTWSMSQALILHSTYVPRELEEAYQPDPKLHAEHFVDIPASEVYYGNQTKYKPNAMHQAYLDDLPTLLTQLAQEKGFADAEAFAMATAHVSADELVAAIAAYNLGYIHFTELTYDITATEEAVESYFAEHEDSYAQQGITRDSGKYVDMRHLLMLPENATVAEDGTVTASEDDWSRVYWNAQNKLSKINNTYPYDEGVFANAAANQSADAGSAMKGGLYEDLLPGQMPAELDAWLFDPARRPDDTAIIRTACGMHLVYYVSGTDIWYKAAEQDLLAQLYNEKIDAIRELYPAQIDHSAIRIAQAQSPVLTAEELLYSDIAHERFPSAPLYLQRDYPTTNYGAYSIMTHGCGITTLAMLATYMADTELTPPTLCARYGRYNSLKGSDPTLFIHTPPQMGFYLKEQIHSSSQAFAALEEGYIVVCLQHRGMWTNGGHFLLLEKINENGMIQIRDSNILNYSKLDGHKLDEFDWSTIPPKAVSYWIFYPKQITHPQCVRCSETGGDAAPDILLSSDYLCSKCATAQLRRDTYLEQ